MDKDGMLLLELCSRYQCGILFLIHIVAKNKC